MRCGLVVVVCACSGAAQVTTPSRAVEKHPVREAPAIDPIAALALDPARVSWIAPGPVQLELGAPALDTAAFGEPISVAILDDRGSVVRVGLTLERAKLAVWIERARLLGVIVRDTPLDLRDAARGEPMQVVLRAGARVRRLAHEQGNTRVRYSGALEAEGWVPDAALDDRGEPRDPIGRVPTGRQALAVLPGAVIRSEPSWTGRQLAVMASGYFLDSIQDIDDAWVEVGYEDGDLRAHGYVSRRDPPGHVHRMREPANPAAPITPTEKLPTGACLWSGPDGEPIGFSTGELPVILGEIHRGLWYDVTIDSPWGPLVVAVRRAREDVANCPK